MNMNFHVLLAEAHPLIRIGLRTILNTESDMIVVAETTTGYDTQQKINDLHPDVLLLDAHLPGPSPKEMMDYVNKHHPKLKVLIMAESVADVLLHQWLTAGISGYVLKNELPETIIRAIHVVIAGDTWFSRAIVKQLTNFETLGAYRDKMAYLTKRERHVLDLIAQGWDNTRIATQLDLAEQTVRNCTSRIYKKLGVSSRAEAIIWFREAAYTSDIKRQRMNTAKTSVAASAR